MNTKLMELAAVLAHAGLPGYLEDPGGAGLARRLRRRDLARYLRRLGTLPPVAQLSEEQDDLLVDQRDHLIVCQTSIPPGGRSGTQRYVWFVRDDTETWWRGEVTIPVRRWTADELKVES